MNGRLLVLIIAFTTLFFRLGWGEEITTLNIADGDITFTADGYKQDGTPGASGEKMDVTITGNNGSSVKKKIVVEGGTHTITLEGVNIKFDDGSVWTEGTCAFSITSNANVKLILKGENTLSSGNLQHGLVISNGATAEISDGGSGSLTAKGGDYGAGINVQSGSLTISSGIVTATGSYGSAGIGGGSNGSAGTISISGGTVMATGGSGGAGIGGGSGGSGGTITISGGTVTATGGYDGVGIGGGPGGSAGTFSTGTDGNAFIITNSISDNGNEKKKNWSGVFLEGDATGKVYGSPVTLTTNAEIPQGKTLEIGSEQMLAVGKDVTLTNSGTLINNGILTGNGTINGTVVDGNNNTLSIFSNVTVNINGSAAYTYNGQNITPSVSVTDKSSTVDAANYLLAYTDNKNVGNATITVTPKGRYYGAQKTATFEIKAQAQTVTPASDQVLYADEKEKGDYHPIYTFKGQVDGEVPAFTGNLGWGTNDKITQGTLKLSDKDYFVASNYELEVTSIGFTSLTVKAADQEATLTGGSPSNGWYTGAISLSAPQGFKIKDNGISPLAATEWKSSLPITQEGENTYSYFLKRDGLDNSATKSITVKLDNTPPTLTATTDGLSYTLTFSDAVSGIDKLELNNKQIPLAPDQGSYTATGTAGDYTAKVTDKAGLSKEISFKLTDGTIIPVPDPEPDPDPNPAPDPDPVFYTVTLPSIEGATTDPSAGSYEVEAWDSFRFYLTLSEGYRKDSQPVVTTDRGETLEPRASDGAYVVRYVRSDVSIGIAGIQKDEAATGMEQFRSGLSVRPLPGGLLLTAATPTGIRLFDSGGRLLLSRRLASGETRLEGLSAGIYLLSVDGGKAQKVRVGR